MKFTAETYTTKHGCNMGRIEHREGATIDEVAEDLRNTVSGWDYAIVSGEDGNSAIVYRSNDNGRVDGDEPDAYDYESIRALIANGVCASRNADGDPVFYHKGRRGSVYKATYMGKDVLHTATLYEDGAYEVRGRVQPVAASHTEPDQRATETSTGGYIIMGRRSEAQKRADAKYKAEKTKQEIVRFYPSELDLYEHVQKQPSKQGYIKALIRADIDGER